MDILFGLRELKEYKNPVVALGVFDGVHLAHRRIIKSAVKKAKQVSGTSIVLTFWPHPQSEKSLFSLQHRLNIFLRLSVNVCIVVNFSRAFSKISAEDFVNQVLVKKLKLKYLYVGENFRFGRGALGNHLLLKRLAQKNNFHLKLFKVIKVNGCSVSSSHIRRLISVGHLKLAEKLLDHPVSILGNVVRGISFGKELGFPTANIDPHHEILPPSGIYTVRIILGGKRLRGLCYIGKNPTIKRKQSKKINIEVYIFNFNKNIYGQYLEIQFIQKLRDEIKFKDTQDLKKAIKKDITYAKLLFSRH